MRQRITALIEKGRLNKEEKVKLEGYIETLEERITSLVEPEDLTSLRELRAFLTGVTQYSNVPKHVVGDKQTDALDKLIKKIEYYNRIDND